MYAETEHAKADIKKPGIHTTIHIEEVIPLRVGLTVHCYV